MPVIGKLIKQTNAITYKRNLKNRQDFAAQRDLLTKLLLKAKKTALGKTYKFDEILEDWNVYEAYQRQVPIMAYDEFYPLWIQPVLEEGKKDIFWPGKVAHFALSSGTTGSPSKRIPVSSSMIRSFQKASLSQLAVLHELDLPEDFWQAQFLTVGGSTNLVKYKHHIEGDLSGILRKFAPIIASPFTRPSRSISKLSDWNVKLEEMVKKAPEWNIGIVAGVPSWCILLMERIIEHYNLKSIHDVWPNFNVYVHGGVFMDPYQERLKKVLGRDVFLLDTYLASEGYFGFQMSHEKQGMQMLLDSGVFFEFVPFNADYFDQDGQLLNQHAALMIDEVQPNMDYALVVTTNAGLWRYLIGDLVRFTDIEKREIIISGRIKQFLSLCGEHLSLDNINSAIAAVCSKHNMTISEFTISAKEQEIQHHWFLGVDQEIDAEALMSEIDASLCELNDDYRSCRKMNLKKPLITVLPTSRFYTYLESKGKLGAQHKFPRVLNKEQRIEWAQFLERN